jgi:hypothetical protein
MPIALTNYYAWKSRLGQQFRNFPKVIRHLGRFGIFSWKHANKTTSFLILGHKAMLDSHLAELYQVTTGNPNKGGLMLEGSIRCRIL